MQIILNSTLEAKPNNRVSDISNSLNSLAQKQHSLTKEFMYDVIHGETETSLQNSGFVGLLSACYSQHLPVAIAPHDIWVLLLSEVSKEVAQHSDSYRRFFTKSNEKESISVPSESITEMPIGVLSKALSEKILFDSGIIFQNFSNETPIVTQTIQAIFCDMASPFYSYSMFCCGIPSIQLLGTTEDWEKVLKGMTVLVDMFETSILKSYLQKIRPILQQFISASQEQVDVDFWKDIFTQKNIGSGGDLTIDGWITKLFITEHSFPKLTNFTATNGVVKYTQLQTKQEFVAIYGGFDKEINDQGFYQLKYMHFTLQKVPYEAKPYRF